MDKAIKRMNDVLDKLNELAPEFSMQIIVENNDFLVISSSGIETFKIKDGLMKDYINNRAKRYELMYELTILKQENKLTKEAMIDFANEHNDLTLKGINMIIERESFINEKEV